MLQPHSTEIEIQLFSEWSSSLWTWRSYFSELKQNCRHPHGPTYERRDMSAGPRKQIIECSLSRGYKSNTGAEKEQLNVWTRCPLCHPRQLHDLGKVITWLLKRHKGNTSWRRLS